MSELRAAAGSTRTAWAAAIASTAVAIPYAVAVAAQTDPQLNLDDSFITLVYANNFAASGAFYYNAGEGAIDGFTSLLDVLVKAFASRLADGDAYRAGVVVNRLYAVALLSACSAWVYRTTRRSDSWRLAACVVAPWLIASSWDFAESVATELESPLFAALAVLAIGGLRLPGRSRAVSLEFAWGALVVLLPLARPEGLVLALILLGAHAMCRRADGEPGWLLPAVCGLTLAAYYAWRIAEFGHWAPNTYYAKSSESRWLEIKDGIGFVVSYGSHSLIDSCKLVALIGAPFLLRVPGWSSPSARRRFGWMVVCALAAVASVVVSGGDSYPQARRLLLVPMTLVLLLPFALLSHGSGRVRAGALAALVVLFVSTVPSSVQEAARYASGIRAGEPLLFRFPVDCVADLTQRLVAIAPKGRIAQSDFQMVKYFAGGDYPVVDLHGLNDHDLAHEAFDERITFGKFSQAGGIRANAEIYVYGYRAWNDEPMAAHSLRSVLTDRDLHWQFTGYGHGTQWPQREQVTPEQAEALVAAYRPATLRACETYFNFLVRRDIARSLPPDVMLGSSEPTTAPSP
jgi:hypothetical protein